MELLISMKADTLNKGIYFKESNFMQMPTAQSAGYFIAEFREADDEKLEILNRYADILQQKLQDDQEHYLELTSIGFKLYKKVDEDAEYMEEWAEWVIFARKLLRELKEIVGE